MVEGGGELVGTGVVMGVVHVLTGPDHLSALATLSANVGHRDAFILGARWGIGHSAGLLVVGGALIAGSRSEWIDMSSTWKTILESLVGVFMLMLGTHGLCKALRRREDASRVHQQSAGKSHADPSNAEHSAAQSEMVKLPHAEEEEDSIVSQMEMCLTLHDSDEDDRIHGGMMDDTERRIFDAARSLTKHLELEDDDDLFSRVSFGETTMVTVPMEMQLRNSAAFAAELSRLPTPADPRPDSARGQPTSSLNDRRCWNGLLCAPGSLALAAGVVHGVAGPGGVLGVIPAVQLRDARLAVLYLGTFCITSTLVMGGFAAFYGTVTEWVAGGQGSYGRRVFSVELVSACLSILVGIVWLGLLSVGKLEKVFP